MAYIPSLGRGHNVLKAINEIDENIPQYIEETDSEVLFRFDVKYLDIVARLLKAHKSTKRNDGSYKYISPYSTKNLPKTKYKIPDDELSTYTNLIKNLDRESMFKLAHISKNFISNKLCSRSFSMKDVKAEQKKLGLKGRNYIHAKGLWGEYCKYLKKELEKENLL